MTGDVAGGQEHRETYRQGGKQSQHDLFDILLHCAEILVFLFCTDLTDFTDIFAQLHPCISVYFRVRFLFCTDFTDYSYVKLYFSHRVRELIPLYNTYTGCWLLCA